VYSTCWQSIQVLLLSIRYTTIKGINGLYCVNGVIFNYCSYENYTWAINLSSLYLLFEYIVSHKQTLWHSSIGYDLIKGLQLIWKDVPLIGRQKSHLDHLTWTLIIARTWLTSENLSPRIVVKRLDGTVPSYSFISLI
jgi:hypothetical protein